ncbi:MAG: hypothetical protein ABIQ18_39730 [Umezawaea sp.]
MSMRTADFPTVAARLRTAATTFERWALVAQAVADENPDHVPSVSVKGIQRPVEALVMARLDQGITAELYLTRAAAIQAVLQAERAIVHAEAAERAYSQPRHERAQYR